MSSSPSSSSGRASPAAATADAAADKAEQPHTCRDCGLSFESESQRCSHWKVAHQVRARVTFRRTDNASVVVLRDAETGLFTCPRCDFNDASPIRLYTHTRRCFGAAKESEAADGLAAEQAEAEAAASRKLSAALKKESKGPLKCPHCPTLEFATKWTLTNHRETTHETRTVVTFSDGKQRTVHREAESSMFPCPRCSCSRNSSSSIRHHTKKCKAACAQDSDESLSSPSDSDGERMERQSLAAAQRRGGTVACKQCPQTYATQALLATHEHLVHKTQAYLTFRSSTDGASILVHQDAETELFACPRCFSTFASSLEIYNHARVCKAAAPSPPAKDGSVDHAALRQLGVAYEEAYRVLVCVPCGGALTLSRLPTHWDLIPHEGPKRDIADVKRALNGRVCVVPTEAATPDAYGPAISSLPCVKGWRCVACGYLGLTLSRHWSTEHGALSGTRFIAANAMPDSMKRKAKLQRWKLHAPYFEVGRGQNAVAATTALQPASARAVALRAAKQAQNSAESSSRLAVQAPPASTSASSAEVASFVSRSGALPSSLVAAFTSAPSLLARAFTFSSSSRSAPAPPSAPQEADSAIEQASSQSAQREHSVPSDDFSDAMSLDAGFETASDGERAASDAGFDDWDMGDLRGASEEAEGEGENEGPVRDELEGDEAWAERLAAIMRMQERQEEEEEWIYHDEDDDDNDGAAAVSEADTARDASASKRKGSTFSTSANPVLNATSSIRLPSSSRNAVRSSINASPSISPASASSPLHDTPRPFFVGEANTWKSASRAPLIFKDGSNINCCAWREVGEEQHFIAETEVCSETFSTGEALARHIIVKHVGSAPRRSDGKIRCSWGSCSNRAYKEDAMLEHLLRHLAHVAFCCPFQHCRLSATSSPITLAAQVRHIETSHSLADGDELRPLMLANAASSSSSTRKAVQPASRQQPPSAAQASNASQSSAVVLSEFAQAVQRQLQATQSQPFSAQLKPDEVATFLGSLLTLASAVLAPQDPQQQFANPQLRAQLEAIINSTAERVQDPDWRTNLANELSSSAPSRSSVAQPAPPLEVSPTPSSLASSGSSQLASSSQPLPDRASGSAKASTESPASSLVPSEAPSDKDKHRLHSTTPSADAEEPLAKRLKLS